MNLTLFQLVQISAFSFVGSIGGVFFLSKLYDWNEKKKRAKKKVTA